MTGWYDTCDPQSGAEAYAVLIRSERDAGNTAGRWLHRPGYADAVLTAAGHDNGIDVFSAGAVAQMKRWRTKLVGIREEQRLAGAAEPGQTCLFFASYGYTTAAKAWAERSDQRVACSSCVTTAPWSPRTSERTWRCATHRSGVGARAGRVPR